MFSEELLRKAESGDLEAALEVADCYWRGIGVEQDNNKAFAWFNRILEMDPENATALTSLGKCYQSGFGVEQDYGKAVEYYERAIKYDNDNKEALWSLATRLYKGEGTEQNSARAIELYIRAANLGDVGAQCVLGTIYRYGEGEIVEVNHEEANKWYMMAAEQDDPAAWDEMAIAYQEGLGVEKDFSKAAEYRKKAAELGYGDSQYSLGLNYEFGVGTERNFDEAIKWYTLAAEQKNLFACYRLAEKFAKGEGVPVNYSKAETYYREVIEAGEGGEGDFYDDAIIKLALMHATKTNDNCSAFPLWKLAAERGNTLAKCNLGFCYYNGWGTSKDDSQALYWWRQAGAEGNETARDSAQKLEQAQILEQKLRERNSYSGGSSQSTSHKSSGGCYVATAVYGSYNCPEVWTLRRFRDYTLAETWYGRAFIKAYYAISPTIVKWFGRTEWFNHMWKGTLDRMVKKLQINGVESTPYEDKEF